MNKAKKKIVRDRLALQRTLGYLITDRGRKPTSVKQAARHFGISKEIALSRMLKLSARGEATRVARGVYAASALPNPATRETLDDLLAHLLKERAEIDAKIVQVKETIALKNAWLGSKGKK